MPAALDAAGATRLLGRCLVRLGPLAPPDEAHVRRLSAGDREALLLQLRRATMGDDLDCVLPCSACGSRLELSLKISDFLLPPVEAEAEWQAVELDGVTLQVRAPNGEDLEAIAAVAGFDEEAAGTMLLRRCVTGAPADFLTPERETVLAGYLHELDPQAEVRLNFTCPQCGAGASALLDAARYLGKELAARQQALLQEIHWLALHYHWSEAEILSVPPVRRRLYLKLLGLVDGPEEAQP